MPRRLLSPLHRSMRQITLALEQEVAAIDCDLRADEIHVLSYTAVYGPCPTGELQRVVGARRSTLTSLLDRLDRRGLVTRSPDPDDRRVLLVQVTGPGADLAGRARLRAEALEQRIIDRLRPHDLKAFERIVAAIAETTGVTVVERPPGDGPPPPPPKRTPRTRP